MVTRKAVPPLSTALPASSRPNPPYPTSPPQSAKTTASSNSNSVYSADLRNSPAFDLIDMHEAQLRRGRSNSDSSHGTWDSEGTEKEEEEEGKTEQAVEVPKPLNVKRSDQNMAEPGTTPQKDELPPSLRIGPAKPSIASPGHGYEEEAAANPWGTEPLVRSPTNPKNPYLLKQNGFVADNSQSEWREVTVPAPPTNAPPPPPTNAPPPPPIPQTASPDLVELSAVKSPTQELEHMTFGEDRTASWETAEKLTVPQQGQAPLLPVTRDQGRPESTWWNDPEPAPEQSAFASSSTSPKPTHTNDEYIPPPGPPPARVQTLIDHEDVSIPSASATTSQTLESSAILPPPAPITHESPSELLQKQRNTTYQIKHVNWLDESYDNNSKTRSKLRNSPILTQNANGPCPLLALVNALIFTTPQNMDTSLTQILSDREQISLGLLLDAVFDELMSDRRAGASANLPDVSDLYSFLLALHTGMNVNPRFVTPATTPRGSWDGVPAGMNGLHPMHKAQYKAGAFEETREMRLYSTFNIPLIHGWTPPIDTPAYDAFVRSAQTFEDAQNIQFMESDLEDKRNAEGLTPEETQTWEDIHTIKSFLETWPTQLTDFGLETMSKSLQPGQVAILFRNDHFSTIYKEPKHGALMTLVTDTGYASHDEIVWESLVDVNGAASEMFSGDFRVVSHGEDVRLNQGNSAGGEEGWTAVSGRRKSSKGVSKSPSPPPLPGPRPTQSAAPREDDIPIHMTEEQRKAAEQEDHDLALALQLQEEEEDRQRQDEQRRKREQELSEQFLSNESEGPRPPIPPRRSVGRGTSSTNPTSPNRPTGSTPNRSSVSTPSNPRAPVNRPSDQQNDPEAPPSYEQAASDRPYRPAGSTAPAVLSQGNAIGAYDALRRQSAYAQQSTSSLPTFAEAGPASPPYSVTNVPTNSRRRSDANRIRRQSQVGFSVPPQRTTQIGVSVPPHRTQPGQGGVAPGHYPGSMQARSSERLRQANSAGAPGVKDAEDKCVVM